MADIKEELQEIKSLLKSEEEEKKKKFRLPFGKKTSPRQGRKGWVTIMRINENGFINFEKQRIQDQTIMVDGVPRLATPDYVLHWKKVPMIIQPNWSVKPFSPEEHHEKSMEDGSHTKGYKILMARMKSDTTSPKPQMGGMMKWIIGAILVGIIAYAFITGGGG